MAAECKRNELVFLTSLVISCGSKRVTPHSAKDDVIVSMHDRASVQTSFCVRVASTWAFVFSFPENVRNLRLFAHPTDGFHPQRWQSLLSPVGTHEPIQEAIMTEATYRLPYSPSASENANISPPGKQTSVVRGTSRGLPATGRDAIGSALACTLPQKLTLALETQNRVTVTPWTQITSEKKHMQLWEKKDRRPRGSMIFF